MATLKDVFSNEKFYDLSDDDKLIVIGRVAPKFNDIPNEEKITAYERMAAGYSGRQETLKIGTAKPAEQSPAEPAGEEPGLFERAGNYIKENLPTKETLSSIYHPVLAGGGAMVGGIVGAVGGIPTGPGAIGTAALGAGLLGAAGEKAADAIDNFIGVEGAQQGTLGEELIDTGKEVAVNALSAGAPMAAASAPLKSGILNAIRGSAAGGLGYAAGQEVEKLDQMREGEYQPESVTGEITNAAKNVGVGAVLDAAGNVVSAVPGAIKKALVGARELKKSPTNALRMLMNYKAEAAAAAELQRNTSTGEQYDINAEQAQQLREEIPGFKPTLDQERFDPAMGQLRRKLVRETNEGARLHRERMNENSAAIENYRQQNFGGENNIEDVASLAVAEQGNIEKGVANAEAVVRKQLDAQAPVNPVNSGIDIEGRVDEAKKPVKAEMNRLRNEIPDVPIQLNNTDKQIQKVLNSKFSSKEELAAVKIAQKDIADMGKDGVTSQGAIGIRRTLSNRIEKLKNRGDNGIAYGLEKIKASLESDMDGIGIKPPSSENVAVKNQDWLIGNYDKKIQQLKDAGENDAAVKLEAAKNNIEAQQSEAIAKISGVPQQEAYDAIKKFNAYAHEQYFKRFKSGAVDRATARGNNRSGNRINYENMPDLFMTPTGAGDLINAIGKDDAKKVMRGHAGYLLFNNAVDSATGKVTGQSLRRFMKSNREALRQYDLHGEFNDIAKAQKAADAAAGVAKMYEKSALARVIGVDPEKAVQAVFNGRNKSAAAREILDQIGDNKAAREGLKNAFADFLTNKSATTSVNSKGGRDISKAAFDKHIREYAPVMRELYKDAPKQKKALESMHQAYHMITRNNASPIGGGSDSDELGIEKIVKQQIENRRQMVEMKAVLGMPRPIQMAYAAVDVFRAIKKDLGSGFQKEILAKALFDPEYAQVLYSYSDGKSTRRRLRDDMERLINRDFKAKTAAFRGGAMASMNREDKKER